MQNIFNLIAVTAVPCNEDNKTLLSALPNVKPKPLSSGSAVNVAWKLEVSDGTRDSFDGLISACQLFMMLIMYSLYY